MIFSILTVPAVAYLFYDSWVGLIPGAVVGALSMMLWHRDYKAKKKRLLLKEFRDVLMSIDAALFAGYSLENGVTEAYRELAVGLGRRSVMLRELSAAVRKQSINEPVDRIFREMADNTGLSEIREFACVIEVVKTSGGNTIEIIRDTVRSISERIEVENEIAVMIAGKKLEQRIMTVMPFMILAYLRISMGSFISALYGNVSGAVFMTVMLLMVLAADAAGRWITNICV